MRVSAEYVKRVISENPGHSIMVAEDCGPSAAKLGYYTGDADLLGKALDMLEQSVSSPYRVVLKCASIESRKGERKPKDKDFVFILPGASASAAGGASFIPSGGGPVNGASLALAERAGAATAQNAILLQMLEEMRAEMKELREDLNAEDEEPMNEAVPASVSVWESPEVMKELIGIGKAIAGSLVSKAGGAPPLVAAPASLPSSVPGLGELSEEDVRAVVALRNMKQQDPDTYNTYAPLILDTYAAKANEQGQ